MLLVFFTARFTPFCLSFYWASVSTTCLLLCNVSLQKNAYIYYITFSWLVCIFHFKCIATLLILLLTFKKYCHFLGWNNLSKEDSKRSLPYRIGITMRHAGVSITITSITDFAAFAVGASTVIEYLSSIRFIRKFIYWIIYIF